MNDKELLYQIVNREIGNILYGINPAFRVFSQSITNYIMNAVDIYIDAFIGEDGQLKTKAAGAYLKDETSRRIDEYIAKFEKDADSIHKENK